MTAAERLVNRISEFVNDYAHEATPEVHELARQFHDCCRSLNERLAKCRDFLRKGMRSEAVQEALSRPSVFELAEVFSFREWEQWQQLSRELDLSVAPEVDYETVEKLKQECNKEELLDPLLHEFRRLVHTGSRDDRIDVLHRIRRHDPDNPVWLENLRPLEEEQLAELETRARQAMANNDSDEAGAVLKVLKSPLRALEAPPELISEVEKWLQQKRSLAVEQEAWKLIEELQEKMAERDYDGISAPLENWRRIIQNPDFTPSKEMLETAGKAGNWQQSETNRRQRQRQHQQAVRELESSLHQPIVKENEINAKWHYLQEFDEPVPEDLERKMEIFRDELAQREAEQRKRRKTIIAAVAVISLLLLAAGSWTAHYFYQVRLARRTMAEMWDQQEYHELAEYLQRLSRSPRRYQASAAPVYEARVEAHRQQEQDRQRELARSLERLQEIKAADFQADRSSITSLLSEARELAADEDEIAALDAWEETWQSWRRQQQAMRDRQLTVQIADWSTELQRIGRRLDEDPADRLGDLAGLEERLQQWRTATDNVSPSIRNQFTTLAEEIRSLSAALQNQLREQEEAQRVHDQLLRQIPQTLGQIGLWEEKVNEFITRFPEAAMTASLRQAAAQSLIARDAVAMTPFSLEQLPVEVDQVEKLESLMAALPAGRQSVWRPELTRIIDQSDRLRQVITALRDLRQVDFYDFEQISVREKGQEDWHTYYIPGRFHHRRFDGQNGTVTRYWGPVYGLHPDSLTAETEHLTVSTETHEVVYSERSSENLIPAARYIRSLMLRMPDDERQLMEYLLTEIEYLRLDDKMAMVPKAVIMKTVADAIADLTLQQNRISRQYRNIFSGINLDVPWFNYENPMVTAAEEQIGQRLAGLPESAVTASQVEFSGNLVLASLTRNLECVGMLWPKAETGSLQPLLKPRPDYRVVWILQTEPNRIQYQFLELNTDENGSLVSPVGDHLFAGQLLFAPADQRPSSVVLEELAPPSEAETISWPAPWPVNQRIIP